MPFIEHFELLNLLHFDLVETWSARESNSERKLLLHRYPKASGLRERLQSMPPLDLGKILQAGEDGDFFFVVTQDAAELRRFLSWVERSVASRPPSISSPANMGQQQEAPEPGDFTRMFESPLVRSPSPPSEPVLSAGNKVQRPSSAPVSFPPKLAQSIPAPDPGEFTVLFDVPASERLGVAKPPNVPRVAAPVPPPEQKPSFEPGELTRLFDAPASQPRRPAREVPSPQVAQRPGAFSELFNAPIPQTDLADSIEKPHSVIESARPFSELGDFTKIFGRADQSNSELGSIEAPFKGDTGAPGLGEATGVFSGNKAGRSLVPQAPLAGGPGDYTRIFKSSGSLGESSTGSTAAPAEQKPPALQAAATKKQAPSSSVVLIIILAAIAVLAIVLILYFLLKP